MQNQVAPLQQAATELNTAAAKLGQAAQAGHQKSDAASQATARQAQAAQQQARQASQQAGQLAQQAGQLANALNQAQPQLQAIADQPAIAATVQAAGADVARAGRHEERLGQTEAGRELQHLAQQIKDQTGQQVAQAATALTQANSPARVQAAAQTAHDAIQSPLHDLNAARQRALPAPETAATPPATPSQLAGAPGAAAKWLARALDSLDAALNPTTGQALPAAQGQDPQRVPAGPTAQHAAGQAATAAAQAQAGSMITARSQGLAPGELPIATGANAGGSLGGQAPGKELTPLPAVNPAGGNWGKLPPKLARDLIDSQREGVNGQYREMVEIYFRALADKAREKQP